MNGWANYETWNMALWVDNDESVYRAIRRYKITSWTRLRNYLKKIGWTSTGDGVSIYSKQLNSKELTGMLRELCD